MSLTHEELERRRHFITGSDVAPIFGVSPWRNCADVFYQKTQGLIIPETPAMTAGTILERPVLEWASRELGPLRDGDWRVHENGVNAATLDGMTADGDVVEAKTSGIVGPGSPHQWGDALTDQIPEYYLLQVQAQLLVTGAARAWVPALLGGRGFVMFCVRRNDDLCELIAATSVQFWETHIVPREPPDAVRPSLETLKRIERVKGKSVPLDSDLVSEYHAAKVAKESAEEWFEARKALLVECLGDAERGTYDGGEFSYLTQTKKSYTVAESTFRVLRHKAAKQKALTNGAS